MTWAKPLNNKAGETLKIGLFKNEYNLTTNALSEMTETIS
jgi:hypothetical protein